MRGDGEPGRGAPVAPELAWVPSGRALTQKPTRHGHTPRSILEIGVCLWTPLPGPPAAGVVRTVVASPLSLPLAEPGSRERPPDLGSRPTGHLLTRWARHLASCCCSHCAGPPWDCGPRGTELAALTVPFTATALR